MCHYSSSTSYLENRNILVISKHTLQQLLQQLTTPPVDGSQKNDFGNQEKTNFKVVTYGFLLKTGPNKTKNIKACRSTECSSIDECKSKSISELIVATRLRYRLLQKNPKIGIFSLRNPSLECWDMTDREPVVMSIKKSNESERQVLRSLDLKKKRRVKSLTGKMKSLSRALVRKGFALLS